MPRFPQALHDRLERLYTQYHRREHVALDPLITLYRYDSTAEREVVGLIAAALAYGNVKAILKGIENALGRMGPSPAGYLREGSPREIARDFQDFRYRVTSGPQMAAMLCGVKGVVERHGGMEKCFVSRLGPEDATVVPALGGFVDEMCAAGGHKLHHLLPHPSRGSACKRLMLFLRWMCRHDAIDPGGWSGVSPALLIIPLDTHVRRMAQLLRLTKRRQPNLRTAMEITEGLKRVCPTDPLRYDFALTRPGILKRGFT